MSQYIMEIGELLQERGMKLVVAESCTGGLIGDLITNAPGSSAYFWGGVVAYAYEVKEHVLNVKHDTLMDYGAVSSETAIEMARGVRELMAKDVGLENLLGLAVTGIAGPGGAQPGKPVGLVWIGLSTPEGDSSWCFKWDGNREQNKYNSAIKALQLLKEYLFQLEAVVSRG